MTDNRNEKRNVRQIQSELDLPYTMALRLFRSGEVVIKDDIVIDKRKKDDLNDAEIQK